MQQIAYVLSQAVSGGRIDAKHAHRLIGRTLFDVIRADPSGRGDPWRRGLSDLGVSAAQIQSGNKPT